MNKAYFGKSFMMVGNSLNNCLGCVYCRADDNIKKSYMMLPSEINPAFRDIPVAVNIFYGYPMIQIDSTIDILYKLEKDNHRGPVIIITKGDLKKFKERTADYKFNLDLHFGLSTFGITNKTYDGGSFERFKENMDVASTMPYHYSVEFRPMIRDINDSEEVMRKVCEVAKEHNTGIGYCGLQVSDVLREHLKAKGITFKEYDGHKFGLKKYVGRDVDREFRKICFDNGVPVFRKTSCLIAWKHNLERDPNAHYYRPNEVGCFECPLKEKCFEFKNKLSSEKNDKLNEIIPFDFRIENKTNHECGLYKLGVCKFPSSDCRNINGNMICIEDELTTTDVRLIKWLTGYTVDAKFRESPFCSDVWKK